MINAPGMDSITAFKAAEPDAAAKAAALTETAKSGKLAQIEEAAVDFEAMFLTEMLKPMFEGIEVDSVFGGGKGEEVFRSLMIDEYGKTIARSGGVGLAQHVKAEMIRIQEAASQ